MMPKGIHREEQIRQGVGNGRVAAVTYYIKRSSGVINIECNGDGDGSPGWQ